MNEQNSEEIFQRLESVVTQLESPMGQTLGDSPRFDHFVALLQEGLQELTVNGCYESERTKKIRDRMAQALLSPETGLMLATNEDERKAAIRKSVNLLEIGYRYCSSEDLRKSILSSLDQLKRDFAVYLKWA